MMPNKMDIIFRRLANLLVCFFMIGFTGYSQEKPAASSFDLIAKQGEITDSTFRVEKIKVPSDGLMIT